MQKKTKKKKSKKKFQFKKLLRFFVIIGLFGLIIFVLANIPTKNIYISGNKLLSDYDILEVSNLRNYPKLFKYSSYKIKNNIKKLELVNNVKVKKNLLGKVTITIDEAKVLFYNRSENKYVLSNKKTMDEFSLSVPALINYVPDTIYDRLIDSLNSLNENTISLISEIEYSPSKSGEVIIDDTRFLLRMRDGNNVYINLINIERLNMYLDISTIFETKGTLGLDSDNGQVVFNAFS